jgi:hypothetical protein
MKPSDDSTKKIPEGSGRIFSDEEIQGLVDLGNVLVGVHKRLISEGWTIKGGIFTTPDGVSYTKETMAQYHEDKKRKAKLQSKQQRKNG